MIVYRRIVGVRVIDNKLKYTFMSCVVCVLSVCEVCVVRVVCVVCVVRVFCVVCVTVYRPQGGALVVVVIGNRLKYTFVMYIYELCEYERSVLFYC